MSRRRLVLMLCVVLLVSGATDAFAATRYSKKANATTATPKEDSDFMKFMFRVGKWIDDFTLKDVDTAYITLPEFPWRVAFTNSEVGIHSTFMLNNTSLNIGRVILLSQTTPSIDLGFNVGIRSLGFGYSWDALNAYARKLNFSIGGKAWGVELLRQTSTNIHSTLMFPDIKTSDVPRKIDLGKNEVWMTNTNVTAWYALNSYHYSHNAALKQDSIQKRTAGSLLLSLSYLNTDTSFGHDPDSYGILPLLLDDVQKMVTHQVAVGLGYGINYTPNNGKVLIHGSAAAQAVFYSINYISYDAPDSLRGFAYPSYAIRPTTPIHFTGTMRAAVSWEINKWVHVSGRVQADNIRFRAQTDNGQAYLSDWNWQVSLAVGVRLGLGRERVNRGLGIVEPKPQENLPPLPDPATEEKKFTLPTWLTDYFFSPTH